jgi:malonyl CoA-acyl carrier protein transacylase
LRSQRRLAHRLEAVDRDDIRMDGDIQEPRIDQTRLVTKAGTAVDQRVAEGAQDRPGQCRIVGVDREGVLVLVDEHDPSTAAKYPPSLDQRLVRRGKVLVNALCAIAAHRLRLQREAAGLGEQDRRRSSSPVCSPIDQLVQGCRRS